MFRLTFAILTILVAYVGFTSYTNTSSMTNLIEQGKEIIQKEYELEQVDIGDFKKVMVYYIISFLFIPKYTKLTLWESSQ